ncbi:hypothetical protein ACQPZZ_10950 [Microbispora sp. CA-135349]|uniref:hypothetical protein n=1 Tax=Microbispora sp. CA-135349 TaxID=3239953 RepID=UPI003D8B90A7
MVVGVDPAAAALADAEANLLRAGAEHGIEVTFHAVPRATEALDDDWKLIGQAQGALLAVASFALHHMLNPRPGHDARDVFLRRLRSLEPTATWLRRLRRCGFTPTVPAVSEDLARVLTAPPDFTLDVKPDHVRLGYRDVPLPAVMTAVPGAG